MEEFRAAVKYDPEHVAVASSFACHGYKMLLAVPRKLVAYLMAVDREERAGTLVST